MRKIVRGLKNATAAQVALCSLPVIGENPEAESQRGLISVTEEYNAILKQIAREEKVTYIPFYERMVEQVTASPGRPFFSSFLFDFLSQVQAAFQLLVLHRSLDEVAARGGWRFHVDGIHFNSRTGTLLADLVQEFVAA
jgi:lysophospholipase L1-like esterase